MAQSLVLRAVPINEMEKLRRVEKDIEEARDIAYKINNNFLFKDELYYIDYIEMRIKQLDSIKRMKSHFSRFYMNYEQTLIMADFTKDVAMNIYDGNDCIELLYKLKKLRFSYRDMELPKTRDEFENRAMLFQFLNDLEDFLTLKKDFRKMYKN